MKQIINCSQDVQHTFLVYRINTRCLQLVRWCRVKLYYPMTEKRICEGGEESTGHIHSLLHI